MQHRRTPTPINPDPTRHSGSTARAAVIRVVIASVLASFAAATGALAGSHGIAMHGKPKYGPDFQHFGYVNPNAPKGGQLINCMRGSFDSVNPLIVRGVSALGVRDYVFESLLARSVDEPFSLYGLLAQTVDMPEDRRSVTFRLNPAATFSDGRPVTADDVLFSHALLRDHGRPNHRYYYAKVGEAKAADKHTVHFTFTDPDDREMPLIMGLMPVLPKHLFDAESFDKTTLEPLVGSGPYRIAEVDPGTSITYQRNPDYWGRDLPVNRGRFNFDTIRYDYYRDESTRFEAFKKGLCDLRPESDPGRWATGYDFPAAQDGRVKRESFPIALPSGMSALVFNTRRPLFADKDVRKALLLLFDFEWVNKTLFHGLYVRTNTFFDRSELSFFGQPVDETERALLAGFPTAVLPEILDGSFKLPQSDGVGHNRKNRRKAIRLLKKAGWVLKNGVLVNKATSEEFAFEIMSATRAQERLLLTYARALKTVGIEVRLRQVDSAQYQRRKQTFDFDMLQNTWYFSLSPGNEQSFYWGGNSADTEGTRNYMGVKDPVIDAMIAAMLRARDRPEFVSSVRALDRVLMSGTYVIPLYHLAKQWVAYWSKLAHPEDTPLWGYQITTWWQRPDGAESAAN